MKQVVSWIWPVGYSLLTFVVAQLLSHVWFFATPWTAARRAPLSFAMSFIWEFAFLSFSFFCHNAFSQSTDTKFKFLSIESLMLSNHFILRHALLLLPSIFPSLRVISNELALRIRQSNYWSFSFSISPSSEYSGLISFSVDWFDLLAVQGTLKSPL